LTEVLAIIGGLAACASMFGVILAFSNSLRNLSFRAGRLDARVEQLETWRNSVRGDMHEVSEDLQKLTIEVQRLATVIEERTHRRQGDPRGTVGI
jgi:uncharacterized protein (DUF3084 family)